MTQEFEEALLAHAMYKKPDMVFAKVRGAEDKVPAVGLATFGCRFIL